MAEYRRNPYNRQGCYQQAEVMRQQQPVQTATPAPCAPSRMQENMERFPVAMLYVPWQKWNETYELDRGLMTGTIFPDLDRPFRGIRKGGCSK